MTNGAPHCAVRVEGQPLTDLVIGLHLEESDSSADSARIVFGDSFHVLRDVLCEGLAIEIDLVHDDQLALVFRGIVTAVSAYVPAAGSPTVELVAHDSLIKLAMRPRTRGWGNKTVSGVVRQIATDHGLQPGTISPGLDATLSEERPLHQVAETDLAFIERLAHRYDSKVYVEHGERTDSLSFVSTDSLLGADPLPGALAFLASLIDFRASFDAWAADPSEELVTTDPATGERFAVKVRLLRQDDGIWTPDTSRLAALGASSAGVESLIKQSAAKRRLAHESWRVPPRAAGAPARPSDEDDGVYGDRLRRRGQTGRGTASGNLWLGPRKRIEILGYGGRWSGVWYLARVRHDVDLPARRYTTSFVCVR